MCTLKYKRIDLMLSILKHREAHTYKTQKRTHGKFWRWWLCLMSWLCWYYGCMHMSKIKYILNVCIFNINYTSINLTKDDRGFLTRKRTPVSESTKLHQSSYGGKERTTSTTTKNKTTKTKRIIERKIKETLLLYSLINCS